MKAKTYKPTFLVCPSCDNETDINISEAVKNKMFQFTAACDCCGQRMILVVHGVDNVEARLDGKIIKAWNLVYMPAGMEAPVFLVAENPITLPAGVHEDPFLIQQASSASFMAQPMESPKLIKHIVGMHAMMPGPLTHERTITDAKQLVMGANGHLSVPDTFPEVRDMITFAQAAGQGMPVVKH